MLKSCKNVRVVLDRIDINVLLYQINGNLHEAHGEKDKVVENNVPKVTIQTVDSRKSKRLAERLATISESDSHTAPKNLEHNVASKKRKRSLDRLEVHNDRESNKKVRKSSKFIIKEKIRERNPNKEYMINEVVLATVPGYPPWPARILNINGQTIDVEFFGTGERNPIRCSALTRFELNRTIPLLQRKCYRKTMKELEMVLGIPNDVSIFQNYN